MAILAILEWFHCPLVLWSQNMPKLSIIWTIRHIVRGKKAKKKLSKLAKMVKKGPFEMAILPLLDGVPWSIGALRPKNAYNVNYCGGQAIFFSMERGKYFWPIFAQLWATG